MKRFSVLLLILLVSVGANLFADTSVLIDFATLLEDTQDGQNEATVVDFSSQTGTGFSAEERLAMKTSLAIENWEVELASSSRSVTNAARSMTRAVTVNDDAARFQGDTILGVRVHFPDEPFNSYAVVRPPFEIPAYMKKTSLQGDGTLVEDDTDLRGTKFDGYGVVKNVGVIKSVSVNVYGNNFPNGFAIVLKDQNNNEQQIFMNYMDFDGWRELVWYNPNYVSEVRDREIRRYTLYPQAEPMRKVSSLVFYKNASQPGGDFIAYIKDITITYDKAVLDTSRDINEEEVWGILSEREEARRTAIGEILSRRFVNLQVLRYLEQQKMHADDVQ